MRRDNMRFAYVPIDERPCNTTVVERMVETNTDIELIMPTPEQLGYKKQPAETDALWRWLLDLEDLDGLVLSTEMLLYGGLIPSRLHDLDEEAIPLFTQRLKQLKRKHPDAKIMASSVIMRTPQYDSADEEPDYYETNGRNIFRRRYLMDKKERIGLSHEEAQELIKIERDLPLEYIKDYETRRTFNVLVNKHVLHLLKDGWLDFLIIPQDDSAEYGYTAEDQKKIIQTITDLNLDEAVHMYPGSDEVGATLITRLYHDKKKIKRKVYIEWSSTLGHTLIPIYEDRPFYETCKRHLRSIGAYEVNNKADADFILYYNVPGEVLQESWDQFEKRDPTYDSFRDMNTFVDCLERDLDLGYSIVIADAAYGNGGDYALIKRLDQRNLLHKITSYKGWNTNANTLGTTLAQGCLVDLNRKDAINENIAYHLLDDFLYQAVVRMELTNGLLKELGLTYFDLKDKAPEVNTKRDELLRTYYQKMIPYHYKQMGELVISSAAPWNRMFEVGLQIKSTQLEVEL